MRPTFDKSVAAEDFLDFARRRRVQAQELHVVPGISFVNRDDIGGVIIKGGEPFLLLFLRLCWCHVIVGFGRAFFEGARCVHRSKRGGATVLRCLLDLGADFRGNRHEVMTGNVFSNLLQVFRDVAKEVLRCGMFALDLLENFSRRFAWIDLFCRGCKNVLLLL